jgi:hypothetical protein
MSHERHEDTLLTLIEQKRMKHAALINAIHGQPPSGPSSGRGDVDAGRGDESPTSYGWAVGPHGGSVLVEYRQQGPPRLVQP